MIARAYTRNQEMEEAITYRAALGDFGPSACRDDPDCWWNQNVDHPSEQRNAEQLAENALINTAVHYHQEAQRLRRQCVEQQAPELCQQSSTAYQLAARAYRRYLDQLPEQPPGLRAPATTSPTRSTGRRTTRRRPASMRAVRDSNLDDTHLSESARRVVESLKRLRRRRQRERGRSHIRDRAARGPGRRRPRVMPVAMPELLSAHRAGPRGLPGARRPSAGQRERPRGLRLQQRAAPLLCTATGRRRGSASSASTTSAATAPTPTRPASVAWLSLRNMAVQLQQDEEVERLAPRRASERQCTFTPDGRARQRESTARDRRRTRSTRAAAPWATYQRLRYQRALDIFRQAEAASGDEQRQLYEQAATMLVQRGQRRAEPPAGAAARSRGGDSRSSGPAASSRPAASTSASSTRSARRPATTPERQKRARRHPRQRVLPPRVQREPLLRLRARGRELPAHRRLAPLRAFDRAGHRREARRTR